MGFLSAFVDSDRAGREQILRQMESAVSQMGTLGQLDTMQERLKLEQTAAPGQRRLTATQAEASEVDVVAKKRDILQNKETRDAVMAIIPKIEMLQRVYGGALDGKSRDIPPEALLEIGNLLKSAVGGEAALASLEAGVPEAAGEADLAVQEERQASAELGKTKARAERPLVDLETKAKKLGLQVDIDVARHFIDQGYPEEKALQIIRNLKQEEIHQVKQIMAIDAALEQVQDSKKQRELADTIAKEMGFPGGYNEIAVRSEIAKLMASTPGEEPPERDFYLSQFRMLEVAISRIEMAATGRAFMDSLQDEEAFAGEGSGDMLSALGSLMGQQSFTTAEDKAAARKKLEAFRSVLMQQARVDYPKVEWGDVRTPEITGEELQDGIADFRNTRSAK